MLIWKIAQTCTEVANLNFWCTSSFGASSSGVTARPQRRPGYTSQTIIRAFYCTCPLLPCLGLRLHSRPGSNQSWCPTTARLWEANVVAFNEESSSVLDHGESLGSFSEVLVAPGFVSFNQLTRALNVAFWKCSNTTISVIPLDGGFEDEKGKLVECKIVSGLICLTCRK